MLICFCRVKIWFHLERRTSMRILLSLLTIISILVSGISAGIFEGNSNYLSVHQTVSPIDTNRADMHGTSRDYLTSETQNYAILPVVPNNNYIKPLRETSNKLIWAGLGQITIDKEWTYLFQSVVPKSTFQTIIHSIQPRAPNLVA